MKKIFCILIIISLSIKGFAQNIGIGTNAPVEKLQVAGNIKADTIKPNIVKITANAGNGKLLTSDAAGNASWQSNKASGNGNIGFGVWGDCATNGNISEYSPIADATGAAGDAFGHSVCISGNYAIVGALYDDVGGNANQGSASIYQYDGSNWILMQKLTDATGAAGDNFGQSVSVSGNYAIVGAWADDGVYVNQGSASIYQYTGSNWVLMQKLTDASGATADQFGVSVSISGNYAVVGANADDIGANADQGSASIYQYNGSIWVFRQKLTDVGGAANDNFGQSVSISGQYLIVGAFLDDVGTKADQGSVSIYSYNGSSWVPMQKLTDATGAAGDYFGYSVSVWGNYAIVGADAAKVGTNSYQGAACIYQFNGITWTLMQKLTDPDGAATDYFGASVFISGNYAIVGAGFDDIGSNSEQGSVSVYLRVGNGWGRLQHITDPMGNGNDNFGYNVAIDGAAQRFLIGASGYANISGKVVFGKVN